MSNVSEMGSRIARTMLYTTALTLLFTPILVSAASLLSISTRGEVGPGSKRMIVGFVVEGLEERQYIAYALGPSLVTAGVNAAIENPKLVLYAMDTGSILARNDSWKTDPNARLIAEYLDSINQTLDDREAAVLVNLRAGAYTLVIEGADEDSGVALGAVTEIGPGGPLITTGTWTGELGNVCLNVSEDGRWLTAKSSGCYLGASLRNTVNKNYCNISVNTLDAIPIEGSSFTYEQQSGFTTTVIEGTFSSPNTVSGTGVVIDGLSTCTNNWSATPVQ